MPPIINCPLCRQPFEARQKRIKVFEVDSHRGHTRTLTTLHPDCWNQINAALQAWKKSPLGAVEAPRPVRRPSYKVMRGQ